jgi:hypothetical protein
MSDMYVADPRPLETLTMRGKLDSRSRGSDASER